MKLTLPGRVAGLSLVAALALTACGSDNTTGDATGSSAPAGSGSASSASSCRATASDGCSGQTGQ